MHVAPENLVAQSVRTSAPSSSHATSTVPSQRVAKLVHASPPPGDVHLPFTHSRPSAPQSVDSMKPRARLHSRAIEPSHVKDAAEHGPSAHQPRPSGPVRHVGPVASGAPHSTVVRRPLSHSTNVLPL